MTESDLLYPEKKSGSEVVLSRGEEQPKAGLMTGVKS